VVRRTKGIFAFSLALILGSLDQQSALADRVNISVSQRGITIRFEPTKTGFATPHTSNERRPVHYGDLNCTTTVLENCMVANMPLLSQVNAALIKPLVAYASKYVVKTGPNAGQIIWSEPQFSIGPTPYTPTAFAQNISDNGCYITSITTIEHAALLNNSTLRLSGRAAIFKKVSAGQFVSGPKALNQLEWQYRRWADKLQPNKKNPSQPSSPDFLELEEFAPDLAPPATGQFVSPASVTSNSLIAAMKKNTTYVIEFSRYSVRVSKPTSKRARRLTLSFASQHKIAISGFQPGTYPLLIDDVGNGERYRVRITSDLHSIHFTEAGTLGPRMIPSSELTLSNPPYTHPLYLIYEGQDHVALNKGDLLFVVTGFDSLSIVGAHPRPHLTGPNTAQ